jgi:hypothetical protein
MTTQRRVPDERIAQLERLSETTDPTITHCGIRLGRTEKITELAASVPDLLADLKDARERVRRMREVLVSARKHLLDDIHEIMCDEDDHPEADVCPSGLEDRAVQEIDAMLKETEGR